MYFCAHARYVLHDTFLTTLAHLIQSREREVSYDLQILADRIEFCWIHLHGIGTLENSLWGYDGQGLRVWLNALAIEASPLEDSSTALENVKESVNIPLDFYPLCGLFFVVVSQR